MAKKDINSDQLVWGLKRSSQFELKFLQQARNKIVLFHALVACKLVISVLLRDVAYFLWVPACIRPITKPVAWICDYRL